MFQIQIFLFEICGKSKTILFKYVIEFFFFRYQYDNIFFFGGMLHTPTNRKKQGNKL
jgi:hypothetical protein